MPPQMDYFYHESRVPSGCGLTREDELDPDVISCMLVGDGAVGKTSMIVSYTSNGYPAEYQQTGFDVFSGQSQGFQPLFFLHIRKCVLYSFRTDFSCLNTNILQQIFQIILS